MTIPVLAPTPTRRRYAALAAVLALLAVAALIASGGGPPAPLVVPVDGGPAALAVSGGQVWVAAPRNGSIAVLDAASGKASMAPLQVGGAPTRLALGSSGLWVADSAQGTVVPIQTRPPRALAPIRVGPDASDVALSGRALWIASSADGRVYVLDGEGANAVPVGGMPVALAADRDRVVVADGAGTLTVLDAATRRPVRAPIAVGGAPADVALAGDVAWVADHEGGRVVAVDLKTDTVVEAVEDIRRPVALAVAGEDVYVIGDRELLRVRDGKVRSRRSVGANPTALAVDGRYVWVAADDSVLRFER